MHPVVSDFKGKGKTRSPEEQDSKNYQEAKRRLVIILSLIIFIECPRELIFALFPAPPPPVFSASLCTKNNGLPCLGVKSFPGSCPEINQHPSAALQVPGMESTVSSFGEGALLDPAAHARRSGPFTVNIATVTPSSAQMALLREEG